MSARPILFVHHANDMYGADIGLLHSITALDRSEFCPIVLMPADMPEGMLSPELDKLGVEYHFAPLGILRRKYLTPRNSLSMARDFVRGVAYIRSLVRHRQVALVYANTFVTASGAVGGWLAGVPVLWHIREILYMHRAIRWVFHRALNLCSDKIVCISHAVRDNLVKEAPELSDRSVVIYNGVAAAVENKTGSITLREELGILSGAPVVGMVGRLIHWKGQEILVQAAALLVKDHPDLHFVAVGSFFADEIHYLKKLEALIANLGLMDRFHLTGYRSDVGDLYSEFDIFVLPSTKPEPFGRVTVEAMMHARPVIATNHGGSCELIQQDITGILVPPCDPSALAAAIDRLLADERLRYDLGQAAAIYADANFSLAIYHDRIRTVIRALLESH